MNRSFFAVVLLLASAPSAFAQTEGAALVKSAQAVAAKIDKSKLAAAFKADFNKQNSDILKAAGCENLQSFAGAGKNGPDCGKATPSAIEKADAAVAALSDAVDAAVKADGTKSLADLYADKLDKLAATVNASKLVESDKKPLLERIRTFRSSLPSAKGVGTLKGTKGETQTPETAQAKYDELAADVAAVVADATAGESLYAEFNKKDAALKSQIDKSRLAGAFKTDFSTQLMAIRGGLCPGARRAEGDLCKPKPTAIVAAIDKLSALSDAVSAAITADGGKSLSDLYAKKVEALKQKLLIAKIDLKDNASLNNEINVFAASLSGGPGALNGKNELSKFEGKGPIQGKAGAMTPEAAEAAYQKVSDDVDAAVALGKTKTTFVADLTAKIDALQAKLDGSKLNAAFHNDFEAKLKAAVLPAGCVREGRGQFVCQKISDSTIASVEDAVSKLSDEVAAAIKADGAKSLYDLYAAKIEALDAKLKGSKVDSIDKMKLEKRIADFTAGLKAPGEKGAPSKSLAKALTVEEAADQFSALGDDVQAAIDLIPKH